MAKASGVSVSSVQRIWRAHGLQPHRVRQFKLSNDPKFVDKLAFTQWRLRLLTEVSATVFATEPGSRLTDEAIAGGIPVIVTVAVIVCI